MPTFPQELINEVVKHSSRGSGDTSETSTFDQLCTLSTVSRAFRASTIPFIFQTIYVDTATSFKDGIYAIVDKSNPSYNQIRIWIKILCLRGKGKVLHHPKFREFIESLENLKQLEIRCILGLACPLHIHQCASLRTLIVDVPPDKNGWLPVGGTLESNTAEEEKGSTEQYPSKEEVDPNTATLAEGTLRIHSLYLTQLWGILDVPKFFLRSQSSLENLYDITLLYWELEILVYGDSGDLEPCSTMSETVGDIPSNNLDHRSNNSNWISS